MAALCSTAARSFARTAVPRSLLTPFTTASAYNRGFPTPRGLHTFPLRSFHGIQRDTCMPCAPHSTGLRLSAVRQATLLSIPARREFHTSGSLLQEAQKKKEDLNQTVQQEATKLADELAKSTGASGVDPVAAKVGSTKPKKLSENIYTIPNLLTASRLLTCPIIGWQVLEGNMKTATGLLFFSALTDLLDGYLARRWNSHTVFGSIADPAADKALMTVMVVTLGIKGLIPPLLAMLIIGRDVGLVLSAFYIRYKSLPPPKTFSRYWDFSLPSASVQPTQISKYNTFLQLCLVGVSTVLPIFSPETQELCGPAMTAFQYLVAGTTIWSGASYVFRRGAVTYLNRKP